MQYGQSLFMSSSTISLVIRVDLEAMQCNCGLLAPFRTSWTTTNHVKYFFGCAMYDPKNISEYFLLNAQIGVRFIFIFLTRMIKKDVLMEKKSCLEAKVFYLRARMRIQTFVFVFS
jgi:hypothetical protein